MKKAKKLGQGQSATAPTRFKGGRFKKGDQAVRIMGAGKNMRRNDCAVVRTTESEIICAIRTDSSVIGGGDLREERFKKKTGVHVKGRKFGWLESPSKRTSEPIPITAIHRSACGQAAVLYNYCS
jgi:hypothetical protein